MTKFEQAVVDEVRRIREQLKDVEGADRFSFYIMCNGPVHHGEIEVGFTVGVNYDKDINGCNLEAVIEEAVRQHDWKRRNKPLMIGQV